MTAMNSGPLLHTADLWSFYIFLKRQRRW